MVAGYVAEMLEWLGLDVDVIEHRPCRMSVVGRLAGSGEGRSLMLNAHMDTVGVDGMRDPFAAEIRDGRLYGRGAYDMKGSLAACLGAVKALRDAGMTPRGDVIVAAVADEEVASMGTSTVLGLYPVAGAIVTEPTSLDVCVAHKGFVWAEVETRGRAAHGSRPDLGVDANLLMGRVLRELAGLEASLGERTEHELLGRGSLHAGTLHGGLQSTRGRAVEIVSRGPPIGGTPLAPHGTRHAGASPCQKNTILRPKVPDFQPVRARPNQSRTHASAAAPSSAGSSDSIASETNSPPAHEYRTRAPFEWAARCAGAASGSLAQSEIYRGS
jgi:acetylornithine deacetylase/succinyl-diaminopimelate desuccinylase-like protein